jgi:hypothetical protein
VPVNNSPMSATTSTIEADAVGEIFGDAARIFGNLARDRRINHALGDAGLLLGLLGVKGQSARSARWRRSSQQFRPRGVVLQQPDEFVEIAWDAGCTAS